MFRLRIQITVQRATPSISRGTEIRATVNNRALDRSPGNQRQADNRGQGGYRDYSDERYRQNYRDTDYFRRFGHGFAVDDAIQTCRIEVNSLAARRFRSTDYPSVEWTLTIILEETIGYSAVWTFTGDHARADTTLPARWTLIPEAYVRRRSTNNDCGSEVTS